MNSSNQLNNQSNEQKHFQNLMKNNQSSHNAIVCNSVGMGVRRLLKTYSNLPLVKGYLKTLRTDKANESRMEIIKDCQKQLATMMSQNLNDKDKVEMENASKYILKQINDEVNEHDIVTLYLPNQDKDINAEYVPVTQIYPLALVLYLVLLGLRDHSKYVQHYSASVTAALGKAKQDYQNRQETFINCLLKLLRDPVCHTGIRHELMFTLNKSYEGLDFIEDARSTVYYSFRENISKIFKQTYLAADSTHSKKLLAQAFEWIRKAELAPLLNILDPTESIKTSLHAYIIEHGTNPANIKLDNIIKETITNLTFKNDEAYPEVLTILETIYNIYIPEDSKNPRHTATQAFQQWLTTNIEWNNKEHEVLASNFNVIYQAAEEFEKYESLLMAQDENVGEIRDTFIKYFKAAATGNFSVNEELISMALKLKDKVKFCINDKKVSVVENFFAKWFADNLATKKYLYNLMLDTNVTNKIIFAGDEQVQQFIENLPLVEGARQITPYEINRVILHGIITKNSQWSDAFKALFSVIISFLKDLKSNSNSANTVNLLSSSYPEGLVHELEFMLHKTNNPEAVYMDFLILFVMPNQVTTPGDWLFIKQLVSQQKAEEIYLTNKIRINLAIYSFLEYNFDMTGYSLTLINSIPINYQFDFVMQEIVFSKLQVFLSLNQICNVLPLQLWTKEQRLEFLSNIPILCKVKTRAELTEVIKQLDPAHWAIFLVEAFKANNILKLFKNVNQYITFLTDLGIKNEEMKVYLSNASVKKLAKDSITTINEVQEILEFLDPKDCFPFLSEDLKLEFVSTLIKERSHPGLIMPYIKEFYLEFYSNPAMLEVAKIMITDTDDMLSLVLNLKLEDRYNFMVNHFTLEFVCSLMTRASQISFVSGCLQEKDVRSFYSHQAVIQQYVSLTRKCMMMQYLNVEYGIQKNLEASYIKKSAQIDENFKALVRPLLPEEKRHSFLVNNPYLRIELDTFIKIYYALHTGQSTFFKTDWISANNIKKLSNDDAIKLIVKHALEKPDSRTAEALRLTLKFGKDLKGTNLIKDVYNYSFANSGYFKRSNVTKATISDSKLISASLKTNEFDNSFTNATKGTRRHRIISALRG